MRLVGLITILGILPSWFESFRAHAKDVVAGRPRTIFLVGDSTV